MPAQRTGTPIAVDASAGNGNTNISVPADAILLVAFWDHWDGNAGSQLSGLTLNGAAFTERAELAEGATFDESGVGVATLASPATGTQNLAWTWSAGGARSEGGRIYVIPVKGNDTSNPVRDADVNVTTGATDLSVTIDSAVTDLVLAMCQRFTGGNPDLAGTEFVDNVTLNSHVYDVGEITPGATSTTVTMTGEEYSSMVAISIRSAAGSTLACDQGTYALTGQAVALRAGRVLQAAQGSYALTGQDVTLAHGGAPSELEAEQGTYSLTGQAVGLRAARGVVCEQGSYALTGSDAAVDTAITAGQGTYSLSGQDISLLQGGDKTIAIGQGTYSLTGQDVALDVQPIIALEQGSYDLTGQDLLLAASRRLPLAHGTYQLSGQDLVLEIPAALLAEHGVYALNGQPLSFGATASLVPIWRRRRST